MLKLKQILEKDYLRKYFFLSFIARKTEKTTLIQNERKILE